MSPSLAGFVVVIFGVLVFVENSGNNCNRTYTLRNGSIQSLSLRFLAPVIV